MAKFSHIKKIDLGAQQQVAERFSELEKRLEDKIKDLDTRINDFQSDQQVQDNRFFTLVFLLLSTAFGVLGKLIKLY
jgi:hypothetical protein